MRGHLEADLDPLGIERRADHPELDYRTYGFSEADLDREIFINNLLGRERATLREIIGLLRQIYCGRIGIEYMHIQELAERQWIQQKFERREARPSLTNAAKKEVLRVLTVAETFERFLDRRYTGTKRFGIEGAESLMPALEAILRVGAELGIEEFVLGMPHRGRLNVLANFMGKPYAAIFSEFQGNASNPEQRPRLGRRQIPSRHLDRPRDRRPSRASVAGGQPVASRSGQPGRARQGARQAAPARRRTSARRSPAS